jgi:hypothetical protein
MNLEKRLSDGQGALNSPTRAKNPTKKLNNQVFPRTLGIKPRMGSLLASLGCSECPYFDLSNRRDQGGGFGDFFSL